MSNIYDVIILGSGPAGLTAAIYAKRAMLNAIIIERNYVGGGQILNTYEVDNYPALPGISGFDLGMKMSEHADKFGIEKLSTNINSVNLDGEIKTVDTDDGVISGRTVVIATGNSPKKLIVPGEEEFTGRGVSYCATCDGAFFKGKITAVVGGGDVAIEDAIFLSRGCEKVYLIHRRNSLRGAKSLQDTLINTPNIELVYNTVVTAINGSDVVNNITIKNVESLEESPLNVNGIFLAVGNDPNKLLETGDAKLCTDERGYIVASEDCKTNIPGVYAAGDIRVKRLRQVVTAVADGANAIESVQEYLRER